MSAIRNSSGSFFQGFLTALTFLTVIRLPVSMTQKEPDFTSGLPWFPAVGLLIGLFTALAAWIAGLFLPQNLVAVLCVILLSGLSGFLHLDGVADTADGFFSSRPKERILEIMKDSRVGPMGVILLLLLLLTKYAAFSTGGINIFLACFIIPFAGRISIIMQMALLPYARQTGAGIGDLFQSRQVKTAAIIFTLILCTTCLLLPSLPGITAVVFIFFNILFSALCRDKIDGYTGDTLGAACESTEAVMAVCMCIGLP